jgi:hypothetical protein
LLEILFGKLAAVQRAMPSGPGAEFVGQKSIRDAILVLMLLAATPALADEKQIVGVASVIDSC